MNSATTTRNVTVSITSTDNVGVIQLVLRLDGGQVYQGPGSSVSGTLTVAAGAHTLAATAFDKAGNQSTTTIRITATR